MDCYAVIRIESIKIKNFKSIQYGHIFFDEYKALERGELNYEDFSSVVGIFGENGSGKSSVIDVIKIIKTLLSGEDIKYAFKDDFRYDNKEMEFEINFLYLKEDKKYSVTYFVKFEKLDNAIRLQEEKISYYKYLDNRKRITVYHYKDDRINRSFLTQLAKKDAVIFKKNAYEYSLVDGEDRKLFSTIFNKAQLELIFRNLESISTYEFLNEFTHFIQNRVIIYALNYFNETEFVGIHIKSNNKSYYVPFTSTLLIRNEFNYLVNIVNLINKVLPFLIPNLKIKIIENTSSLQKRDDNVSFTLLANRNEKYSPLYKESNGIQKMIALLSGIIEAFNNDGYFLAIDEIDTGIFEYLLGEVVSIFESEYRGQVLFTGHNLRALEKMHYKNVFFTTTDTNNRFTRLTDVRQTNNLRDVYYKKLNSNINEATKNLSTLFKRDKVISTLKDEETFK